MTLPYLPGFWDEISKNATAFAGQLPQIIQPDSVANKRLQEMIQQNPMLLSQIENMTPEARMAMEQTLGFKKQTPLRGLPEGAQLRAQREEQQAIAGLTPDQRAERMAKLAGTRTQTQITREQQKFDQDIKTGQLQIDVLTGQVKDMKRLDDKIDAAEAANPSLKGMNFKTIANRAVRTGEVDPQLMTAIQADPGAKQLFDIAYTSELTKFKNELDVKLSKSKSPETQGFLLRTLAEIGNQLNDQEMRTLTEMQTAIRSIDDAAAQNPLKYLRDPNLLEREKAAAMEPFTKRLEQIRKAATENTTRTTQLAGSMGLTAPPSAGTPSPAATSSASPMMQPPAAPQGAGGFNLFGGMGAGGAAAPQVDAEARMAMEAIRMRPQQEAQIRARYKQRTGKDLP